MIAALHQLSTAQPEPAAHNPCMKYACTTPNLSTLSYRAQNLTYAEALSDLINIPRVAITVIDGVRDDALKALVTPALVNELAKIDAAA